MDICGSSKEGLNKGRDVIVSPPHSEGPYSFLSWADPEKCLKSGTLVQIPGQFDTEKAPRSLNPVQS